MLPGLGSTLCPLTTSNHTWHFGAEVATDPLVRPHRAAAVCLGRSLYFFQKCALPENLYRDSMLALVRKRAEPP